MQHIRESLPELRERLQKRLQEAEAELAGYGDPLLEAKGNAGALLLHFFSKFARNFQVGCTHIGLLRLYPYGVY